MIKFLVKYQVQNMQNEKKTQNNIKAAELCNKEQLLLVVNNYDISTVHVYTTLQSESYTCIYNRHHNLLSHFLVYL